MLTNRSLVACGAAIAQSARMSSVAVSRLPTPYNEPMLNYGPGSDDRAKLIAAVNKYKNAAALDIPCVINGKEVRTGTLLKQVMPSDHQHVLANVHQADEATVRAAIEGSLAAKAKWELMPLEHRAMVFKTAADLLSTKYRFDLLAATVLGQAKTAWQAEIDAAAELIDFWRFNVKYAEEIYSMQPQLNPANTWNRVEWRALEGFVWGVSPFNFTAIGGNISTAPAIMGNVVLWKPAQTAMLSNYIVFNILREAGLPDGVIQFLPGRGPVLGKTIMSHRELAGIHFTGSTDTFKTLWRQASDNLDNYRTFPRMVGETGGKNFHFVHESADLESAVNQTVRSAFEYSGQKCSACSRLYVPDTLWPKFSERLVEETKKLKIGQPFEFSSFSSAVIDGASFKNIAGYVERSKTAPDAKILVGGNCDNSKGFFIQPTVIQTTNPMYETMVEELFGPVLTVYVYPANKFEETLKLCDQTSPYALTGAFFARDRAVINQAAVALRNASGNFYVNDKSTGAVVGQQPFGGARASGTNDKAGHSLNLLRWTSARTIKETTVPLNSWSYPSIDSN